MTRPVGILRDPRSRLPNLRSAARRLLAVVATGWLAGLATTGARAEEPIRLTVSGGLAGVSQCIQRERPFRAREIAARSHGRLVASLRPFDAGSPRGADRLQLMRLGVVPLGIPAADRTA